jgi:DNA invertase Pin-like site-specific DNA recombinase
MDIGRTVLYARVSTTDQQCENQRLIMEAWAIRNGITDYQYFWEEMSSRKTRAIKQKLIVEARRGHINTIVVVRIDRWARSLQELVADINELVERGVRFVAIENGMDFDKNSYNSTARLMLQIISSFAEFEREMIRERTIEGVRRAQAKGKHCGRPRKNPVEKTDGGLNGEIGQR